MSTSTEFVTREEFLTAIDLLNRQVQGLYNLADRMGYTVDVPEGDSVPESVSDASAPSVLSSVQTTDNTNTDAPVSSGVDYGAVAYGLSEIKAKFRAHLGTSDDLTREYEGAVEWFVGCFAGDASFDANAFRAAAGSSAG
jgi:hypothetical protein